MAVSQLKVEKLFIQRSTSTHAQLWFLPGRAWFVLYYNGGSGAVAHIEEVKTTAFFGAQVGVSAALAAAAAALSVRD